MLAWLRGRLLAVAIFMVHSLNHLLEWLFASRNPGVVFVRETIRRNNIVLSGARRFIGFVRQLPTLPERLREFFRGGSLKPLPAVLAARQLGGAITVAEMVQIWDLTKEKGARVLAIAAGPELEQIRIIVTAARFDTYFRAVTVAQDIDTIRAGDFDLIVTTPISGTERQIAALRQGLLRPDSVLPVGNALKRSDYYKPVANGSRAIQGNDNARQPVARRLQPRVVFLNDVGFQYGAGIALRRQAASFLLKGFEVHLVSWTPGINPGAPSVVGISEFEGWQGIHNVSKDHQDKGGDGSQLVTGALSAIRAFAPDIIITGNIHGTGFPLELAQGLKAIDALVVSYMHDCFWATGRCAYSVSCELYRTGCNETCPTADEYPKLAPDKIAPAWRTKADIFEGEAGIPLVTNSGWMRSFAARRFGDRARIDCVPLALDHELFLPIPKAVARRLLGLPTEGLSVVMGAVDILNKWKGGDLFREIHRRLQGRDDVSVFLFGQSSTLLKSIKSFGLVDDERLMPFILNSADIFIGTATEEAFGQTLLEASACGVPVAAFDRGGVSDVVVDGETGLLVKDLSADALYNAVDRLLCDAALRDRLGRNARKRVETHFTLAKQADAWIDHLATLSDLRSRSPKPIATGRR